MGNITLFGTVRNQKRLLAGGIMPSNRISLKLRILRQIIDWLAEKRHAFRLSPAGKAIAGGLVIILATGIGSGLAEEVGNAFGSKVTILVGGALAAAKNGGRSAALFAALAAGVTGGSNSVVTVARPDRLRTTLGPELLHSFKVGFHAARGAKLAAIAAAFLGSTGAATIAIGLPASIGAGVGGLVASAIGAVVTVGLTAMLDYPIRGARARARKAQAARNAQIGLVVDKNA
jgi:hypothetical protein